MVQVPDRFPFPGIHASSLRVARFAMRLKNLPEVHVHRASQRPHRAVPGQGRRVRRRARPRQGGDRGRGVRFRLLGGTELQIQL